MPTTAWFKSFELAQEALLSPNLVLHEALKAQEIHWKQRSRIAWLNKGDQNTKFFHQSTKARSSFNRISHIFIDGRKTVDSTTVQANAMEFFTNLYKPHEGQPNLLLFQLESPNISNSENSDLISMPWEEEIKKAVFALKKKSSSPGPDGFNGVFFTSTWSIIGKSVS